MTKRCWTNECTPATCTHLGGVPCNCATAVWAGLDTASKKIDDAVKKGKLIVDDHGRLDRKLKADLEELDRLLDEIAPNREKIKKKLIRLLKDPKGKGDIKKRLEELLEDEALQKEAEKILERLKKSKKKLKGLVERIFQTLELLEQLENRARHLGIDGLLKALQIPYIPNPAWRICSCETIKHLRLKDLQAKIESGGKQIDLIGRLRPGLDDLAAELILDILGNAIGAAISAFSSWVVWIEAIDNVLDVLQCIVGLLFFSIDCSTLRDAVAQATQLRYRRLVDLLQYYRTQKTKTCLDKG